MNEVTPVNRTAAPQLSRTRRVANNEVPAASTVRSGDKAEFSVAAKLLGKISELPDVRTDLVNEIRAQIADGTYDTPDKIEALLDELADDLQ